MIQKRSIRNELIRYLILFALLPVSIVVMGYAYVSYSGAEKEFTKSRMEVLSGISREVRAVCDDVLNLSELIYINPRAMSLLRMPPGTKAFPYFDVKTAQLQFSDLSSYISSARYLRAALLFSDNGLDIRWSPEAAFIHLDDVKNSDWYRAAQVSRDALVWIGEVPNPSGFGASARIAVLQKLIDPDTGWYTGNLLFLFDRERFSSLQNGNPMSTDTALLIFGDAGQLIFATDQRLIAPLAGAGADALPFSIQYGGDRRHVFHTRTPEGWRIYHVIDGAYFVDQQRNLLLSSAAIFLIFGAFGVTLARYLSIKLTRSFDQLKRSVAQISSGNFETEIAVFQQDEIDSLAVGIRVMQAEIKKLIGEAVAREQSVKRLEIQAMQAQLNPHFIFNTLNAIRIMADMQGGNGISDTVRALAGIIRGSLRMDEATGTLREELAQLENYFFILKVRYKGKLESSVAIEEDALLDCRILRFVLQPLVENAAFHGIEPKGGGGSIQVRIQRQENTLRVSIRDDGIGMDEQLLRRLNDEAIMDENRKREHFGIGARNIKQRIRLMYGPPYGLYYASKPGEFTRATVVFPLEWER